VQPSKYSRTAFGMAAYRAAHQLLEKGSVLHDPFARAILGPEAEAAIAAVSKPSERPMRLFMAFRSRFADEKIAAAVERGMTQVVVLGAGLDTFALRNPHSDLTVFEVDYPATQEWKRQSLEQAGLAQPSSLRFTPMDFESQKLPDVLAAAGFDAARPAFFVWLGVVIYLTGEAISTTLDFAAAMPQSEIVFDYSEALDRYPPNRRPGVMAMAEHMAKIGEPWLSYFDSAELAALLRAKGFDQIEDLGPAQIAARFSNASEWRANVATHLLHARRS
jgi:methyltransferase (TIGR00027 family)